MAQLATPAGALGGDLGAQAKPRGFHTGRHEGASHPLARGNQQIRRVSWLVLGEDPAARSQKSSRSLHSVACNTIAGFIQGEQTCQLLPTAGEGYHPMPIATTTVGRYHLLTRRSLLLIRATGALRAPRPYGGRKQ